MVLLKILSSLLAIESMHIYHWILFVQVLKERLSVKMSLLPPANTMVLYCIVFIHAFSAQSAQHPLPAANHLDCQPTSSIHFFELPNHLRLPAPD